MPDNKKTKSLVLSHFEKYPLLQIQDLFKFLHQSTFGCEHAVDHVEAVLERIEKELALSSGCSGPLLEQLDGDYSRIGLSYLKKGLSASTLAKLFYVSASENKGTVHDLEEKLKAVFQLTEDGQLPFSTDDFLQAAKRWKLDGYKALHHSPAFNAAYKPAYRVISNMYVWLLPLLANIDKMLSKGAVRIAIEGGSAGGKTTLCNMLEKLYDCTVFHTDDYFLRPEQRTNERLAEIGGNFDRERFFNEILSPLWAGENVAYRPFSCSLQELMPTVYVEPKALTIVEGVYSAHPLLESHYDLCVFLDIEKDLQRKRILKRNTPAIAKRYFEEWIPMENKYFLHYGIKEKCGLKLEIKEQ